MIKFLDIIGINDEPIVKRTEPYQIDLKTLIIIISGIIITILLTIILIKKINNSKHKE